MINKIIAWAVAGIAIFIWAYGGNFVTSHYGASGMGNMLVTVISIALIGSATSEGNLLNQIIDTLKSFLPMVGMLVIATITYSIASILVSGGAFDVMVVLKNIGATVIVSLTTALFMSCVNAGR